jgi:hypothetical protein
MLIISLIHKLIVFSEIQGHLEMKYKQEFLDWKEIYTSSNQQIHYSEGKNRGQ